MDKKLETEAAKASLFPLLYKALHLKVLIIVQVFITENHCACPVWANKVESTLKRSAPSRTILTRGIVVPISLVCARQCYNEGTRDINHTQEDSRIL